jgi:hypothetical protein
MVFIQSGTGKDEIKSKGFIIGDSKNVLAISNCIWDDDSTIVTLADQTRRKARVIKQTDTLALLSISETKDLSPLRIASGKIESGSDFVSIKYGRREYGKITSKTSEIADEEILETSITYPSSVIGAPALNAQGEVTGIFTEASPYRKFEYLIPAKAIRDFLGSRVTGTKNELNLSYKLLKNSSVFIRSGVGMYERQSKGFFLSPSNNILTTRSRNFTEGPVTVFLPDDQNPHKASLVFQDERLALLSLDDEIHLPSLLLAAPSSDVVAPSADLAAPSADVVAPSADVVAPSEDFVSIEYFFSETFMNRTKRVFGKTHETVIDRWGKGIKRTTILYPGFLEGVAALNSGGEVIGIFSSVYPSRKYEYLIPSRDILKFLDTVYDYRTGKFNG